MLNRRDLLATAALAPVPLWLPGMAHAQAKKDTVVVGMTLEPPGLDPTAGAASSIAEVTQYNIYETLTKINADGSVSPMLAEICMKVARLTGSLRKLAVITLRAW